MIGYVADPDAAADEPDGDEDCELCGGEAAECKQIDVPFKYR